MELITREKGIEVRDNDKIIDFIPTEQFTDVISLFSARYMKTENVDKILIKDSKGAGFLITKLGADENK